MKKTVRMFSILMILSMLIMPISASAQQWSTVANIAGVAVLDDFNRADGALGRNWSGNQSKYRVVGNQLSVRSNASNSDIYWKVALGADQEANITFTDVSVRLTAAR